MKKLTCLPAGKILPTLLVFTFFIITGSFSLARAQQSERGVTMMNVDGEDVKIWGDDDQACTAIRARHTECQAIADKCVKDGGCAPQLATLNFMGCDKCDAAAKPCFDAVEADYKQCIKTAAAKYKEEQSSPEPTDQQKTSPPVQDLKDNKKDEPFILKFLGINPFELWLRIQTWSQAPKLFFWLPEMSATEILDLDYQDGMIRVEIDRSGVFPANPKMTALNDTSGAQIQTRDQSEYQNLQPNQDIPDGASIRINKPTRFDIGAGDDYIEVQPAGQTGWAEFQIQKSKENESVDIIEAIDSKVKVRVGAGIDRQTLSEITNKVETDAWKMPFLAGEKVMDMPGVENTKRYSWDDGSGAVIKSNDWEKIEFKDSTVKLKEGEIEVKVRNDNPTANKFTVDADGFFDLVVVQTHFFVSYNPKTKKGVVIVYEGEVEIKTKDGKVVKVKPDSDEPGVVIVTQKLSPIKLAITGLILVVVIGGGALFLKRKFAAIGFSKKKK